MPQQTTFYVLLETSRHFTRSLLRGVIRWSNLYGPVTIIASPGHVEQSFLLTAVKQKQKVGIIARLSTPGVVEARRKFGTPVITIEPSLAKDVVIKNKLEISEFLTNSPQIARMGAEHLMSCGFRRFAYCGLPQRIWSDIRQKEFHRIITQHGYECHVYPFPVSRRLMSREEEHPYLAAWLASLPKPIAVMTCNDDRGAQIIETCNFEGHQVPEQVAVLGVDDDDLICELTHPALSSIRFDLENAGFHAGELLHALVSRRVSGYHCIPLEPMNIVTRLSSDVTKHEDVIVRSAIRFIRSNYQSPIGVSEVARELDISRRTLERRFTAILGQSVLERILAFRREQAKELLRGTDDTIEQIAESAGFTNLKQMLRSFEKYENMTPTQFRRKRTAIQ